MIKNEIYKFTSIECSTTTLWGSIDRTGYFILVTDLNETKYYNNIKMAETNNIEFITYINNKEDSLFINKNDFIAELAKNNISLIDYNSPLYVKFLLTSDMKLIPELLKELNKSE